VYSQFKKEKFQLVNLMPWIKLMKFFEMKILNLKITYHNY